MKKILFVCLGNICRSPMAEIFMKELLNRKGISEKFHVDSVGTSDEESGNGVYPPVRDLLESKGISVPKRCARQICERDFEEADYIIAMDASNQKNLYRRFGEKKPVYLLLDFADRPGESVADPW